MTAYELFLSLGEPFAAGLFEYETASPVLRYSNALARFWEAAPLAPYEGGMLYPAGVNPFNGPHGYAVRPHYANTSWIDQPALRQKSEEGYRIMMAEDDKTVKFHDCPHTVGGMGWTHSFPNYKRVLDEGLLAYRRRVEAMEEGDFKRGMFVLLDGIDIYHARCLALLREAGAPEKLIAALERVPHHPAEDIYEALVCLNFIYYVDGCDDIGPLDRLLAPYHKGEDVTDLIREYFRHVDENDGWSGTLGPEYNEITRMCIRVIHNGRRPNLQLLVTPEMPDWVWEECAASLSTGCGQPALYHCERFLSRLRALMPEIPEEDLSHMAFGGCTETMLEGMSNVGSDDAGINVALIFSDYMRACLAVCPTFEEFWAGLVAALRREIAKVLDRLNEYRRTRALYRPDLVRTLLVEDCLDTATEFHAGGARWNWSVINLAGTVNVIDSLNAIRTLVYEERKYTGEEFLALLDAGDPAFLARCRTAPAYGADDDRADLVGRDLFDVLTDALSQRECYPKGKFYAVSNQFTTYVHAGRAIPATPDGRAAGAPLCDSLGAIHGNDKKGPTAMLRSVSKLPLEKIIGTPITNIRIAKNHLEKVLKPLTTAFFAEGGMQLQVSCLSREEMLDAQKHPERHRSLVVRVGGFSEYFNRLDPAMQQTVIDRTEH